MSILIINNNKYSYAVKEAIINCDSKELKLNDKDSKYGYIEIHNLDDDKEFIKINYFSDDKENKQASITKYIKKSVIEDINIVWDT